MAKGETKKTNEMLATQRNQQNSTYTPFVQNASTQQGVTQGRENQLYGDLYGAYSGLANGTTPMSGGGGGGYVAPQFVNTNYAPVRGTYEEFQKTGGIDLAAMRKYAPQLENLVNTGGLDATAIERMRGAGVFDEFSKTGGLSDADTSLMRSKASSAIPSFFKGIQSQMNQAGRIQGGSAAVRNAQALKLAREGSRSTAEAQLNNELGIVNTRNAGRQWGAGNLASSEAGMQQLRTGNILGAGSALTQMETQGQAMTQQGREWGTGGIQNIEEQTANEANRQAEANASAANANSSAAASNARYQDQMRMAGLSGLQDLYGSQGQRDDMYAGQFLQGAGAQYGLGNDQLSMRYGAPGNNTSPWEKIANIGVGAAGALFAPPLPKKQLGM